MLSTAARHDALAPTRENLRDPAPSATAISDQYLLVRTSNQSSQLVPSCLCFLPRTRAATKRDRSASCVTSKVEYSSCFSGSASGTGMYFHCGPAVLEGGLATAFS